MAAQFEILQVMEDGDQLDVMVEITDSRFPETWKGTINLQQDDDGQKKSKAELRDELKAIVKDRHKGWVKEKEKLPREIKNATSVFGQLDTDIK